MAKINAKSDESVEEAASIEDDKIVDYITGEVGKEAGQGQIGFVQEVERAITWIMRQQNWRPARSPAFDSAHT